MASGPITSWQIDGETVETMSDFIFWGSKITASVFNEDFGVAQWSETHSAPVVPSHPWPLTHAADKGTHLKFRGSEAGV